MSDKDLTLWLRLRDEASAGLKALLPSLKQIGLAVGLAAAAGVALSIGSFTDFQTSLNNVKAVSQATAAEMALFEQQALDMGASTKFSAQEAADAQAFLAMAGLSVQESLAALPGTLQLAAAGQLDLASAADLTTNVMSGYRLVVGDIPRINDVLAVTAAAANTTVGQMGEAMSFVAPVAAAAGIEFEEASAALGRLASNAFQGERGGTALRGILIKLMTPTTALESLTDKYSLSLRDVEGNMRPLNEVLGEFNTKGVKGEEVLALFGARAGPAMLALLAEGSASLRGYAVDLEDVTDSAQRMADVQQEGIVGAMTNMKSAASTLSIIIGKELAPAFIGFAETATEGMRWLGENIGDVLDVAKALAAGVLAAAAAYVIMNAGLVGYVIAQNLATAAVWLWNAAITVGTGGLNLIIPAIGLAVAAVVYWRDEIMTFLSGAWEAFTSGLTTGYNLIADIVPGMERIAVVAKTELAPEVAAATISIGDLSREAKAAAAVLAAEEEASLAAAAAAAAAELVAIREKADAFVATIQGMPEYVGQAVNSIGALGVIGGNFLRSGVDLGTQYSEAFAAGFVSGPGGVATVLPMGIVGGLGSPSIGEGFAKAGSDGGSSFIDSMGATFAQAFAGGGGFMGGLQSVMTQGWGKLFVGEGETAATGFLGKMQGVMGKLGGIPLVGPLLAAFGPALIGGIGKLAGKVWGGIKKLFGGPSEAEQAAREMFAGFHKGAVEALGGTQRFADEVQVAISAGWDRTLAETRAGFILMGTDMGRTYDEAFADYGRYQEAVGEGNTELMKQIEEEYAEWGRLSAETAAETIALWESASAATISAHDRAKDAGVKAYDETYLAAIEAGEGQEVAANAAANAQLVEIDRVLAAEGVKYARIAAFDAAMALGAHATAAERNAAAREASRVAIESWDAAMVAVVASDQAATDAIAGNSTSTAEQAEINAWEREMLAKETAEHEKEAALDAAAAIATAYGNISGAIRGSMGTIGGMLDRAFKPRTIRVRYDIPDLPDIPDLKFRPEGRQHGGPVSAGRPYVVGEGGKSEIFVPGQSGSVVPNSGIPTAEDIGAAVAVAMRRSPLVVPRDAVTDAVLGNSPSRRALAGFG